MKKGEDARWFLVSGWKGTSAAGHFEKLAAVLTETAFEAAEADRTMEDLRHLAYRNGIAAAQVFRFVALDYLRSDAALSKAHEDLYALSDDVLFLRILSDFGAQLEAMAGSMTEDARIYAGFSPSHEAPATINPLLLELREAFRAGRDEVRKGQSEGRCPVFARSAVERARQNA